MIKCHYLISTTPNLSLNCSKVTLPKPLVMMSAIMFSLGQYLTDIVFCSTCFRTKLYGISICSVRLWNFGLLDSSIALLLSSKIIDQSVLFEYQITICLNKLLFDFLYSLRYTQLLWFSTAPTYGITLNLEYIS